MLLLVLLFCVLSASSFRNTDLMPRSVVNLRKATAGPRRAAVDDAALVSGAMERNPYSFLGRLNVSSVFGHSTYFQDARRAKPKGGKKNTKFESASAKNKRLKAKAFNLMQQFLFASQERLWPLQEILDRHQNSLPYRMAFIFDQLQLLVHDAASIVSQESKRRPGNKFGYTYPLPITQRVQIYWALMRRNIDATFLVDYLLQKVTTDNSTAKVIKKVLRKDQEIEMMLRQEEMSARTNKATADGHMPDVND